MPRQQTAQGQANQQGSALQRFLRYAPRVTLSAPLVGTLAAGAAGGGTSLYTFANDIPAVPFWCSEINIDINLTVKLTNASTAAQTFSVSPYAPYCAHSSQLTLAGAPPWALLEHTVWYLDQILTRREYDPGYLGLGNNGVGVGTNPFANTVDQGITTPISWVYNWPIAPGATAQSIAGSGNVTHNWVWTDKIILQRRRKRLFGAVPFGDPKNRPQFKMQLNPMVGLNPESSLYVNVNANITAATVGTTTIIVKFIGHRLDLLPKGIEVPEPTVGMGLTVDSFSVAVPTAGTIMKYPHQDAMLYQQIHALLINNALAQQADYWSFWVTEEQKSARWEFDNAQNTFQDYFREYWWKWDRYPVKGHYVADFLHGEWPELPSETPYEAFVTPDTGYANAFGIVPTPNMQTGIRIPTGTALTSAYYRVYSVGLVTVPY